MLTSLLCCLLLGAPATTPPGDEYLYLNAYFDLDGFASEDGSSTGGFSGSDHFFPTGVLPEGRFLDVTSRRFGRIRFLRPDTDGDAKNFVTVNGQTIRVLTKRVFNVLFVLGASHHGDHSGWVELEYEGGATARAPFGLSEWYSIPAFDEEVAFEFPWDKGTALDGRVRIHLQYVPIPVKGRLTAIRLPELPRAAILALTLGSRSGVPRIAPPVARPTEPAPVAIFSEPGFPCVRSVDRLDPQRLAGALEHAGLQTERLDLAQILAPETLTPARYPVLVNPYGETFPMAAAGILREYRRAGGAMVHLGPPFRQVIDRSPYGGWTTHRAHATDPGRYEEYSAPDSEETLGAGRIGGGTDAPLSAASLLTSWGLGSLPWSELEPVEAGTEGTNRFALDPASLPPGAEILPLVTYGEGGPAYAAVIRHGGESPFSGCFDVWIGSQPLQAGGPPASRKLWDELVVRGVAWILKEKGKLEEEVWKTISSPAEAGIVRAAPLEIGEMPPSNGSPFPPAKPLPETLLTVDVSDLPVEDRLLMASAQGLLRSSGEKAVFLVEGMGQEMALRSLRKRDPIQKVETLTPREVLETLGHRRAVIVDPFVHGSLNFATMVGATEGLLVAYPPHIARYGLEATMDLRGLFSDGAEMLRWTREHIWPQLEKRVLCVVPPVAEAYHFRDYAIAHRLFVFWVPSPSNRTRRGIRPREELDVLAGILSEVPPGTPVIGSLGNGRLKGPGLHAGTAYLSTFGKAFVPLDLDGESSTPTGWTNLSVLSAVPCIPHESSETTKAGDLKPERGRIYVAMIPHPVGLGELTAGMTGGPRLAGLPERVSPPLHVAPGALLDILPGFLPVLDDPGGTGPVTIRGTSKYAKIHPDSYGSRYGASRSRVYADHFAQLAGFLERHDLRYVVESSSSGRFRGELEDAGHVKHLPETTFFVPHHAWEGVHPLTASYRLGRAVVFHDLGGEMLADLLESEDKRTTYTKLCPLFVAASPGSLLPVLQRGEGKLPEGVTLVRPEELGSLFRQWSRTHRLGVSKLVEAGSVWKYHDGGVDLGLEWRTLDYDDSTWKEGPAELGYGDASAGRPEATVISYGPDARNKHPCYYFRRTFRYDGSPGLRLAVLEVIRDDSCIVYLNGKAAFHSNLPESGVDYSTHSTATVGGNAPEEHRWNPAAIAPSMLRRGRNAIAVEVHQASPTSSDLSFDLKLTGYALEDVEPGS